MDNDSLHRHDRPDEFTASVEQMWQNEQQDQQAREDDRATQDNPERGASAP